MRYQQKISTGGSKIAGFRGVSPGMNELSLYFSGMNGGGGSRGAGQTPGPHVIADIAVIGKEEQIPRPRASE